MSNLKSFQTTADNLKDFKVQLNSSDDTGNYLSEKLKEGNGIDLAEVVESNINKIEIAVDESELSLTTSNLSDFDLANKEQNDLLSSGPKDTEEWQVNSD